MSGAFSHGAADAAASQTQPGAPTSQILESVDELPVDLHVRADFLADTFVHKLWHGTGHIMAGRLVVAPGVSLHSRTAVLPDGTFCAAVHPSRKLVFYAHGYEPLVLAPPDEVKKSTAWFGDITMARVPAKELATVKGVTAKGKDTDAAVTVRLSLAEPPEIWEGSGDEGSSPRVKPLVGTKTLRPGQTFEFTGLSPVPYVLAVQQPGGVDRVIPLVPKRGETIDVSGRLVEQSTVYTFHYVARTRPTGGKWQEANPVATTKVAVNGATSFHFTETRDSLRNKLDIRLFPRQREGDVAAMFFYAPGQHSFFYDLGTTPVEDPSQVAEAEKKAASANRSGTVSLHRSQTYFLSADNVNGVDVQCLFRVE